MEEYSSIESAANLPVVLPEDAILARLGRNRHLTAIAPAERVQLRLRMEEAFAACHLAGRWTLLRVTARSEDTVTLEHSWTVESRSFAEFVADAPLLWLGAVTAGSGVADLVRSAESDMAKAVVYDAAGSEIADEAMGILQKLARQALRRKKLLLGERRFSIGYGGVTLAHQREVFARLRLAELGMTLTDSCIMQPEKSVTAFATVHPM